MSAKQRVIAKTQDKPIVVQNYLSRYWEFTPSDGDLITINKMFKNQWYVYAKVRTGRHGEVYAAYDKNLIKYVAIKVYKHQKYLSREVVAIKSLQNFKYFCKCFYTQERAKLKYIVMDLKGPSLTDLVDSYGPLSLYTALTIGRHMVQAVEIMHKEGILHNNINSDNFVIGMPSVGANRVYLVDFSLSDKFDPENVPPQYFKERRSRRYDLYRVLYIMILLRTAEARVHDKDYSFTRENPKMIEELIVLGYNHEFLSFKEYLEELTCDSTPDYNRLVFAINRQFFVVNNCKISEEMEWQSDPDRVWISEKVILTPKKETQVDASVSQSSGSSDAASFDSEILSSLASETNVSKRQVQAKRRLFMKYLGRVLDETDREPGPSVYFESSSKENPSGFQPSLALRKILRRMSS